MTLMKLGELDAAEQRLTESVRLHETVFGADHSEMASDLDSTLCLANFPNSGAT